MHENSDTDVVFIVRNSISDKKHGGTRRSLQMIDVLRRGGLRVSIAPERELAPTTWRRMKAGFPVYWKRGLGIPFSYKTLLMASICGEYIEFFTRLLEKYPRALIITEHTLLSKPLIEDCASRRRPVILAPHDIDAIGGGGIHRDRLRKGLNNLADEIQTFQLADRVFCISWESHWLLRNFDVSADCLPYFPASEFLESLGMIRKERETSMKQHFLILGTALHTPTYFGMQEAICWIQQNVNLKSQVVVAGFGTEKIASTVTSDRIRVAGSVADEEMKGLLVEAKAVIVHQTNGCGALTRISESLIAGVPVIANTIAARSYRHVSGVEVYYDAEELSRRMSQTLPTPPFPARPVDREDTFVRTVKELLAAYRNSSSTIFR